MEELPQAQDLSNWVLGLPNCAWVVDTTPNGKLVNPDPNAQISGIKGQLGGGFTAGKFSVTLEGRFAVAQVSVAAKGSDVVVGNLSGPSFLQFTLLANFKSNVTLTSIGPAS